MKKTFTTTIAYADNTFRTITDEGNLTMNQIVLRARIDMENNRNITFVSVCCGHKAVEMVQVFSLSTGSWEIRTL